MRKDKAFSLPKVDNLVNVYVIHDRLSGVYSEPIFKINHDVMKRYFYRIAVASPEARPVDYDLFVLGSYDTKNSILFPLTDKEYLCNGSDVMRDFSGEEVKKDV